MKLAEALAERADFNGRANQLAQRLRSSAIVQEGEEPAEDPRELLEELERCYSQLEGLIARINLTNASARVGGDTLTELLARRDCLTAKLAAVRNFANAAGEKMMRHTHMEVKVRPAVDVRAVRKDVDAMSKELRELDLRIQEANWTVELR